VLCAAGVALLVSAFPAMLFAQIATPAKKNSATQGTKAGTQASSKPGTTKKTSAKRRPRRVSRRGQTAPTAERISEIQSALGRAGHYSGAPTGKWDVFSTESLKKFQSAHGLKPTGKLDAVSLQKLGLGSEVAGLSPPRTPADSARPSGSPPH